MSVKQLQDLIEYHPPLEFYPQDISPQELSLLEIGPGRGDFLFELARANPHNRIGAIEIKRKRFEKLIPRMERLGFKNILLIHGDARVVLPQLFNTGRLQVIYIFFSDPWPKGRHEKHRLFQGFFTQALYQALIPGGQVILAHDDARYFEEIARKFSIHKGFLEIRGGWLEVFNTFYAEKWRAAGRSLQSAVFQKLTSQSAS